MASHARLHPVLVLAMLLGGPAVGASGQAAVHLDVTTVAADGATLSGPLAALDLGAPAEDPSGSFQLWLEADDLTIENDYANSTYAARVPLFAATNGQDQHLLGNGSIEATSAPSSGAPRILIVPLGDRPRLSADASTAHGELPSGDPTMANPVPYNRHDPVTAPVAGTTSWLLRDGRLVVEGSVLVVAWGMDLTAASATQRLVLPTGERLTPTSASAPDAAGFQFDQQVHALARNARLEVTFTGSAQAQAYLAGPELAWSGDARLAGLASQLPAIEGLESAGEGEGAVSGPGRLVAGPPRQGLIPVDLWVGDGPDSAGPSVQAALDLPEGGWSWLAISVPVLALLVPSASLPWLRRVHARRLAAAEEALEQGQLEAAADAARRLAGSRWFAVDAAAVGAEACLRAGDARQALAFLDGRPWRSPAQGLRLLLRARALTMLGESVAAGRSLAEALAQAPDLGAMARRDPGLQALVARGAEGYT